MKLKWKIRKSYLFPNRWIALPPGYSDVGFDCNSWKEALDVVIKYTKGRMQFTESH